MDLHLKGHVAGIDVGSTSTRVAVYHNGFVKFICEDSRDLPIPNVISFTHQCRLYGAAAKSHLLDDATCVNTVQHFTRLIGLKYSDPHAQRIISTCANDIRPGPKDEILYHVQCIDGVSYQFSPEQLLTMHFKYIKHLAMEFIGARTKDTHDDAKVMEDVVISSSHCISSVQRTYTKNAAVAAGFRTARIVNVCTASYLSFPIHVHTSGLTPLVGRGSKKNLVIHIDKYIIHAGILTFKRSIKSPKVRYTTDLSMHTYDLSSDGFERALCKDIRKLIQVKYNRIVPENKEETLKRHAGSLVQNYFSTQGPLRIFIPARDLFKDVDVDLDIPLKPFSSVLEHTYQYYLSLQAFIRKLLHSFSPNDIKHGYIFGHVETIPMFSNCIKEIFGKRSVFVSFRNNLLQRDAAAKGAALLGRNHHTSSSSSSSSFTHTHTQSRSNISRQVSGGFSCYEKISCRIGYKVLRRRSSSSIHYITINNLPPCQVPIHIETERDNQREVFVSLWEKQHFEKHEGERTTSLGKVKISGIKPNPKGVSKLTLYLDVDVNGLITIQAAEVLKHSESRRLIVSGFLHDIHQSEIRKAVDELDVKEDHVQRCNEILQKKVISEPIMDMFHRSRKKAREVEQRRHEEEEEEDGECSREASIIDSDDSMKKFNLVQGDDNDAMLIKDVNTTISNSLTFELDNDLENDTIFGDDINVDDDVDGSDDTSLQSPQREQSKAKANSSILEYLSHVLQHREDFDEHYLRHCLSSSDFNTAGDLMAGHSLIMLAKRSGIINRSNSQPLQWFFRENVYMKAATQAISIADRSHPEVLVMKAIFYHAEAFGIIKDSTTILTSQSQTPKQQNSSQAIESTFKGFITNFQRQNLNDQNEQSDIYNNHMLMQRCGNELTSALSSLRKYMIENDRREFYISIAKCIMSFLPIAGWHNNNTTTTTPPAAAIDLDFLYGFPVVTTFDAGVTPQMEEALEHMAFADVTNVHVAKNMFSEQSVEKLDARRKFQLLEIVQNGGFSTLHELQTFFDKALVSTASSTASNWHSDDNSDGFSVGVTTHDLVDDLAVQSFRNELHSVIEKRQQHQQQQYQTQKIVNTLNLARTQEIIHSLLKKSSPSKPYIEDVSDKEIEDVFHEVSERTGHRGTKIPEHIFTQMLATIKTKQVNKNKKAVFLQDGGQHFLECTGPKAVLSVKMAAKCFLEFLTATRQEDDNMAVPCSYSTPEFCKVVQDKYEDTLNEYMKQFSKFDFNNDDEIDAEEYTAFLIDYFENNSL